MWAYTIDLGYDGSTAETFNWTTESPKVAGWYWVMDGDTPCIAEVFFAGPKRLMARIPDEETPIALSYFTHWLGPLPVPEAPV